MIYPKPEKKSFIKIINSRITEAELQNHPEIKESLKKEPSLRFNLLKPTHPCSITENAIKTPKNFNLVEELNTFDKLYTQKYLNDKISLARIIEKSKENGLFLSGYKNFDKLENKSTQQEMIIELKKEYEKKRGYIPELKNDECLFDHDILLNDDDELKKYVLLDIEKIGGKPKKEHDYNSYNLLKKISHNFNESGNSYKEQDNEIEYISLFGKKNMLKIREKERQKEKEKENLKNSNYYIRCETIKNPKKHIAGLKKEINNTKNAFRSLDEIDDFLYSENKRLFKPNRKNRIIYNPRYKDNERFNLFDNSLSKSNDSKLYSNFNVIGLKSEYNKLQKRDKNIHVVTFTSKEKNPKYKDCHTKVLSSSSRKFLPPIDSLFSRKQKKKGGIVKFFDGYKQKLENERKPLSPREMRKRDLEKLYEKISKNSNPFESMDAIKTYLKSYRDRDDVITNLSMSASKKLQEDRLQVTDFKIINHDFQKRKDQGIKTVKGIFLANDNRQVNKDMIDAENRMLKVVCNPNSFHDL